MAIFKRGKIWWVDVYAGNPPRRIRKSAKTTVESQARIIEQTLMQVNSGLTARQQAMAIIDAVLPAEKQGVKLEYVIDWYRQCLTDERVSISYRTLKQRMNILGIFVRWAKDNTKAVWADEIRNDQAFAFAQALNNRGLLGKTLNSYLGDLSTVWKMLVKRGKCANNPWTLARVQRDRDNEHTGRAFTDQEMERLYKVAQDVGHDWYGMVLVGAYTGLRMPDITDLRWRGDPDQCVVVDIEARRIYGTPSKTKGHFIRVNIPMHDKLVAFLGTQDQTQGDWVFPWRHAHPASYKVRGDDKSFADLLSLAKIVPVSSRDKLSFHCLRHTFISRLAEAGVAQDIRMRLAGHTNAATSEIYTHDDVSGRKAISSLK